MLEDDDFLWKCALSSYSKSMDWIVPDRDDEPLNFLDNDNMELTFLKQFDTSVNHSSLVNVKITELKGHGVLDVIGGEVWEASLLLCTYIISDLEKYITSNVMELGSGVGLPSFLLTELKLNNKSKTSVTITDNDPRVLKNIINNLQQTDNTRNISNYMSCSDDMTNNDGVIINVKSLDWFDFTKSQNLNNLYNNNIDLIIGSALCYSPYHVCLADLINFYLSNSVKEVIIIQIKDLPGFDRLIQRLTQFNIKIELTEYPYNLYLLAKSSISHRQLNITNSYDDTSSISTLFTFNIDYICNDISSNEIIRTPCELFILLKLTKV